MYPAHTHTHKYQQGLKHLHTRRWNAKVAGCQLQPQLCSSTVKLLPTLPSTHLLSALSQITGVLTQPFCLHESGGNRPRVTLTTPISLQTTRPMDWSLHWPAPSKENMVNHVKSCIQYESQHIFWEGRDNNDDLDVIVKQAQSRAGQHTQEIRDHFLCRYIRSVQGS